MIAITQPQNFYCPFLSSHLKTLFLEYSFVSVSVHSLFGFSFSFAHHLSLPILGEQPVNTKANVAANNIILTIYAKN